ncbi:MAG: hypothetical protein KDD61_17475 [Bdellovibrionales bacterium]|nr:hypothetical protein [Bdellovibrionales bacterium]
MKKWTIILLGFIVSPWASAGDSKGNGGDVIVCQNQSVQLLDYFDARQKKWPLFDFSQESDFRKIVTVLLNQLQTVSPFRAQLYQKWFSEFFQEVHFIPGKISLGDISDEDWQGPIPKGCEQIQVANQNPRFLPPGKRYAISLHWWQQLDPFDQAGLVLHELIYRELQSPTSSPVREFLQWMSSAYLYGLSNIAFIEKMKQWGFLFVNLQSILINIQGPLVRDGQGVLREAYPHGDYYSYWNNESWALSSRAPVHFYSTGSVKSFSLAQDKVISTSWGDLIFLKQSKWAELENRLFFYESGQLAKATVGRSTIKANYFELELTQMNRSSFRGLADITFYPNGVLAEVSTAMGWVVWPRTSNKVQVVGGTPIGWSDRGRLLRADLADAYVMDLPQGKLQFFSSTQWNHLGQWVEGQLTKVPQTVTIQGQTVLLDGFSKVKVFPNSLYLQEIVPSKDVYLLDIYGKSRKCPRFQKIQLDEQQKVVID